MKIGILTYHWVANFGANLQTLSTYMYFTNKGFDTYIINWVPYDLEKHYKEITTIEQLDIFKKFQEQYFKLTKICRNSNDISNIIIEESFDLIIIGSDAVLTYEPFFSRIIWTKRGLRLKKPPYSDNKVPNPYWGDFLNNVQTNTVMMSVSAQNTSYEKTNIIEKLRLKRLLNKMKYISVRDIWTQEMIKSLTNGRIVPNITPDPVFAFNYNIDNIIDPKSILRFGLSQKYILFSIDNNNFNIDWIKKLESIADENGFQLVKLPKTSGENNIIINKNILLPISPIEWYSLIKYSSGYIGVLMHPIIVALHNSVPVFSIDTYGFVKKNKLIYESSKIFHIMKKFNLLENYYNIKSNLPIPSPEFIINKIINFDKINCSKMSKLMYNEYIKMMNNILSVNN